MLLGDLTVPLFLVGLGVAVMLTGISQAGWKHPLLIKALFGTGIVLFIGGLFWSELKNVIPNTQTLVIENISDNPESWFVALILALMAWMLPRHPSHQEPKTLAPVSHQEPKIINKTTPDFIIKSDNLVIPKNKEIDDILKLQPTKQKEFTSRSPEFFLNLYKTNTSIQANLLFKPYIGLWINVSGIVFIVTEYRGLLSVMLKIGTSPLGQVLCSFGIEWRDYLLRLNENDPIEICGQITSCDPHLVIRECEIIQSASS